MANGSLRSLSVLGEAALDIRTCKPDGPPWDFSKRTDLAEALQLVKERKPTWVVGSPPCTAFCRLMALNPSHWTDDRIAAVLTEGRMHVHCMFDICEQQLAGGRHCLREHPHGPRLGKMLAWPAFSATQESIQPWDINASMGFSPQHLGDRRHQP